MTKPNSQRVDCSSKQQRTLLFLIDCLALGGAQQMLVMLGRRLVAQGDRVIVCSLQPCQDLAPRLRAAGAEVICLSRPRPSIKSPLAFFCYVAKGLHTVLEIIRKQRVDIVHAHLSDAEFIALTAGMIGRIPMLVTTVHAPHLLPERHSRSMRNMLRTRFSRLLYARANHIIAVSEEVAGNLTSVFGIPPQRIALIENCVDLHRSTQSSDTLLHQLGIPCGHRVLATVGRLEAVKNCSLLLEAVAHLRRDDLTTLIIGTGGLELELRRQAGNLGIEDRVRFLGLRDDVPDLLALADVFVLPSKSEGTSLALLEAMALGKAIVATDIPGNRKPLTHGENALLVPVDEAFAMAEAISRLLDDRELAGMLGAQASARTLHRYDMDSLLAMHENLWNSGRQQTPEPSRFLPFFGGGRA